MDKASDFYSEDCGLESRRGCISGGKLCPVIYAVHHSSAHGHARATPAGFEPAGNDTFVLSCPKDYPGAAGG